MPSLDPTKKYKTEPLTKDEMDYEAANLKKLDTATDPNMTDEMLENSKRYCTYRLSRFFLHYDKDRVKEAEGLVEKNMDTYQEFFRDVVKKYGPDPDGDAEFREKLERFLDKYAPEKKDDVDLLLFRYEPLIQAGTFFDVLEEEFGPHPDSKESAGASAAAA